MYFSAIHATDWPPETLLGVTESSLFCEKVISMELKSEIIAYAPFWKSWNRGTQNGACAMISLLISIRITFSQKSLFSLGNSWGFGKSEGALSHQKVQNDTLSSNSKCVKLTFPPSSEPRICISTHFCIRKSVSKCIFWKPCRRLTSRNPPRSNGKPTFL